MTGLDHQSLLQLFDHAVDAILIADPASGLIVEANQRAAAMFGSAVAELVGRHQAELHPEHEREMIAAEFRRHSAEIMRGRPSSLVTCHILQADGTELPVEIIAVRVDIDGRPHIAGYFRDLSVEGRAEHQLQAMNERIRIHQRAIVEIANHIGGARTTFAEGCRVITEAIGRAMGCARVSVWMLEDGREDLVCQDLYRLGEDRHESGLRLVAQEYPRYFQALYAARSIDAPLAQEDPRTSEFRDGYLAPLGITSMLDATIRIHGEVAGVVCFEHVGEPRSWTPDEVSCAGQVADLTVQLKLSEERRQEDLLLSQGQRMEALGKLAGGIAHDFNNMLAGILGSADLLGARPEADEPAVRRALGTISKAAARAADLTAKLLAFSRKRRDFSSPVDIHEIIDDALEIFQRGSERPIAVERCFAAAATTVVGDPADLQSVMLNLLINARDACGAAGSITIRTAVVDLEDEDRRTGSFDLDPGPHVEIAVVDTGSGIAAGDIDRIFEPFYTTKPIGKGTGLGLAAVYGIVANHHGAIRVESEVDRGTTFTIYLPLGEAGTTFVRDERQAQLTPGRGRTVLVVDDEDVVREMAAMLLQHLGFQTIEADGGEAGVACYRARGAEIDLVLLDMTMPGMSGEQCFAALRQIDPDVRVVITSGFASSGSINQVLKAGAAGFIKKPYSLSLLGDTLTAC